MKGIQILIVLLFSALSTFAQIFPGDADDNGVVDHYDILPIAYAYGTVGPARLEEGNNPAELEIAALWEETFPGGQNYAYADANGDGLIDFMDLLAVHINYNLEYDGNVTPVFTEGVPGIDAPLYFDLPPGPPITASASLEIPLYLGTDAFPVDSMHGIAFSIDYNSDFFESVQLELDPGWVDDGSLFIYEAVPQFVEYEETGNNGKLDVALAHLGKEHTSSGFGQIGTLNIIIQDVLVDLMPPDKDSAGVSISIKDVKLIDGNYHTRPIIWDSLELMVYQEDALTSTSGDKRTPSIRIFPNPFTDQVHLYSTEPILAVETYSLLGSRLWSGLFGGGQQISLNRTHFAAGTGTYLIRIQTETQAIQRKLILVD